ETLNVRVPTKARPWLGGALAIVLAGIASIALRQDSNWDLQNYHLYNAWAFVHNRFGLDWAPAQLQSFYSPLLDLPFYALLAADVPPRLIAFALAIPTGIAWYFFARIVATLFADAPIGVRGRAIVAAIAIGVTAPMPVSLIGLTMNDWYPAAFVMAALWLLVRDGAAPSARTLLAAGALVGAAAGLKLTGSIYCVGLVGGLLAAGGGWQVRVRAALIAGIAMAVTLAITAGPWMWLMYERYGNPLFPYFNDVFRSPWGDPVAYAATRFGPSSPLEWLVFPFMLLWKLQDYVSEAEFRDARPALLYALALASIAWTWHLRARGTPLKPIGKPAAWRLVTGFFV